MSADNSNNPFKVSAGDEPVQCIAIAIGSSDEEAIAETSALPPPPILAQLLSFLSSV